MAEEGLKIKIGADDAELQQGLQRAGTSIENFAHKTSYSTFLARDAVLDLGHTLRDLPYAISNPAILTGPIDRVAQLFTSISTQSGGAKAALSAIGAVLTGPSGILIGFELITTVATFLFGHSIAQGAKDAKVQVESLSDSIKKIPLISDEAGAGEAGNIAKIQGLAKVISDTNAAYGDRKHALEELRETNKAYFGDLTLEDAATGKLTKTINEYSKALINEAIQKKFVNEIADTAKKAADAEDTRSKALTKVAQAQTALNKANGEAVSDLQGTQGIANTRAQTKAQNDLVDATQELRKANDDVTDSLTLQAILTDRLNKTVAEGSKLKPLKNDTSQGDALKREIEATQKLRDELDKLGIDSTDVTEKLIGLKKQLLSRDSVKLGLSSEEINLQLVELNRELQNAFDKQGKRFEIKAQPSLDIKREDLLKEAEAKIVNPFSKAVEGLFKERRFKLTDIFPKSVLDAQDEAARHLKKMTDEAKNLGDVLQKDVAPAFDNLFNDILSGKGIKAFEAFGQAIADVIKKLIEAAVEALIFNAIIGIFSGGSTFGGGSQSFLGGFKNLFGGSTGIHLNSVNSGGISGTALHSVSGFEVAGLVKGQDLALILKRVNLTNNRIH